jgi:hypothetical protein
VLVLSGETRAEDIEKAPEDHQPDLVFADLAGVLRSMKP